MDSEFILEEKKRMTSEGWRKWPDNKKPNTKRNLLKYDYVSVGFQLWFREKE